MGGTDIDSGSTYLNNLAKAVDDGELKVEYAKLGLKNSYKMRMMMGLFDPATDNQYKHIETAEVGSAESQAKSLLGAEKGMVLLKQGPLPFKKGKSVAVIGQAVSNTGDMTGNYDGPLCTNGGSSCFPNIGQAVTSANAGGTTTVLASTDPAKARAAAAAADQVILVVDNAKDGGGEGKDRTTIGLSADQIALATAVIAANKNTVLVLINGGMISIDGLVETAPAILEAFMPGVHGGTAIASTIFGENNPGGKLPVTMYHSSYVNESKFLSMDMNEGPGRSYKYFTGTPLYSFGFGLSYTTFSMQWPTPPPAVTVSTTSAPAVTYNVTVTNTGEVTGDEVVLAFTKPTHTAALARSVGGAPVEIKRLFGFKRVTLAPRVRHFLARVSPGLTALRWVCAGHTKAQGCCLLLSALEFGRDRADLTFFTAIPHLFSGLDHGVVRPHARAPRPRRRRGPHGAPPGGLRGGVLARARRRARRPGQGCPGNRAARDHQAAPQVVVAA